MRTCRLNAGIEHDECRLRTGTGVLKCKMAVCAGWVNLQQTALESLRNGGVDTRCEGRYGV